MNWIITTLLTSPYVRAWLLSQARHAVTAIGAGLVAKGYIDSSVLEGAAGLVATTLGFWLGSLDVKNVDKKIETALNTPPPKPKADGGFDSLAPVEAVQEAVEILRQNPKLVVIDDKPSPKELSEEEVTRQLNLQVLSAKL